MLLRASTGGDLEATGLNGSGVTEGGGHGGARTPHIGQVPPHMEIVVLKNHIVNYYGARKLLRCPPKKSRAPPAAPPSQDAKLRHC